MNVIVVNLAIIVLPPWCKEREVSCTRSACQEVSPTKLGRLESVTQFHRGVRRL